MFLAMIIVLGSVAACSPKSPDTGNSDTKSEDTVKNKETQADSDNTKSTSEVKKIIVFQSKVEIIDQLEALAKEYEAETGIEVEVWGTTGDDYFQQLKTKLANNQGPTVFSTGGGEEISQLANYAADLSDLSWIDKIESSLITQVDGKAKGIPYTVEGFGLVYNKNLIDATALTSTDDFVQMMKDQAADGVNGFSLSSESYFLIGHILNTPFALQDDPEDFVAKLAAGEVTMADNAIFQEFAEMYVAIRENSTVNPLEVNYDKECGDLATGKTAAIHQGNWCYGMFSDYEDVNVGLAALPLAGNDKLAVAAPSFWSVNASASEAEQQAGKDFITWLYTSETGKHYLYDEFGFIPVIEGDVSENLDPLSQDVSNYVQEGKIIGWPNSLWPAGVVNVYLVPVAEEFFTTDMSAEALLEALDNAWAQACGR